MTKSPPPVNHPNSSNSPPPTEDDIQAAKYTELCQRIGQAKQRGQDFELRGAMQIALYRWKDERKFKRVFKKSRYPYTRDGFTYCLSVNTAERWEQFLVFCGAHGLDPTREADKHGFGPPDKHH